MLVTLLHPQLFAFANAVSSRSYSTFTSAKSNSFVIQYTGVVLRTYVHTATLCVITQWCLHFSASNPFDALPACSLLSRQVRRESRRFKEHKETGNPHCYRKNSHRRSHKEGQTADGIERQDTSLAFRSFILNPVGSPLFREACRSKTCVRKSLPVFFF